MAQVVIFTSLSDVVINPHLLGDVLVDTVKFNNRMLLLLRNAIPGKGTAGQVY